MRVLQDGLIGGMLGWVEVGHGKVHFGGVGCYIETHWSSAQAFYHEE